MVWIATRVFLGLIGRNIPQHSVNLSKKCLPCSSVRRFASVESSPEDVDEIGADLEAIEREKAAAELEAKRNKSRLKERHYKLVHCQIHLDPSNPEFPQEETVKFRRKIAARYGQDSGINLGISWPTKQQLDEMLEYERVAHPFTLQEIVEKKRKQREEESQKLLNRQRDIEMKVGKLDGWMKDLKARQHKKLNAAKEAQEKKDMLIEEVRQHFGYSVSMKDPRFQEMLEQKEKDIKKAEREAKKVKRAEKAKASNAMLVEAIESQKSS